jgi:hypothetical protein
MRTINTIAASLALLCGSGAFAAVKGDYVEVRTASVFAGACHYNGELVTTGRDAILAWNVTEGEHNGVNLAGVKAVAVVSADANLSDANAVRKSEIVIDGTEAQVGAWSAMVKQQSAATLGEVLSVKRGPITFKQDKDGYTVAAAGFASAQVQPMPDAACCKQPNLVWYEPLASVPDRKVGHTASASYAGGKAGEKWQRSNENSAFYGAFTR